MNANNDDVYDFGGFNWFGAGYSVALHVDVATEFPARVEEAPWRLLSFVATAAKHGHFQQVALLQQLLGKDLDILVDEASFALLGDAGPDALFEPIRTAARNYNAGFEVVYDACTALSSRGRLCDLPLLLDAVVRYHNVKDAEILPVLIADILDPGDYSVQNSVARAGGIDEYRKEIEQICEPLAAKWGTDISIFRGEPVCARRIAKLIHHYCVQGYTFPYDVRRKFEAMTGIDCSSFYKDEEFHPLAAQAISEEFLESPQAALFKTGHRYFFGRPVP